MTSVCLIVVWITNFFLLMSPSMETSCTGMFEKTASVCALIRVVTSSSLPPSLQTKKPSFFLEYMRKIHVQGLWKHVFAFRLWN
ncbi:unnamed protein product [Soboliphyme baturini]|uniref:Secreted protein n=1 Tax=Soboliphyme baturini TaxID=241478 RepID=A0A183J9Z2_9BILA|nr:unnamed protein product [Soboliphyme baturini]